MDSFIATILPVGFNFAPSGWQLCNGQLLSVNQYQAVYALIGNIYGGSGATTFGLPDLRGRAPVGFGVRSNSTTNYQIGSNGGAETTTLTTNQIPAHTHGATFTPTSGSVPFSIPATAGNQSVSVQVQASATVGSVQIPAAGNYLAGGATAVTKTYAAGGASPVALGGVSASLTGQPATPALTGTTTAVTGGTVAIANTGAGMPATTQSPFLAINFIFCLQGLFPTRD